MDIFGVILVIMVLSLLGGAGYFAYDYIQHKKDLDVKLKSTETKIESTAGKVTDEGNTRMSNLKYMVGEINKVHDEIYTTLETRVDEQKTSIAGVQADQGRLISGLGSLFKFEADPMVSSSSSNVMSIMDLPGNANVNVELLKHVTAIGGLTAKDLKTEDGVVTGVKLCGTGDSPRCIQFPNENGDTYITNLANGRSVVMDSVTEFTNKIVLKGSGIIESPDAPIQLVSEKGVTTSNITTSYLNIKGDGSKDLLKVSNASDALRIDATGKLILPNNNTIQVESSKLIMNAPQGLEIRGRVDMNGEAYINGKEVAVRRT